MSFVAIGLFVLACGWNIFRLFLPTRASALRNEGHPQYFGAALAAAYVAFLALFLHAAALKVPKYANAITTLAALAPDSDKEGAAEAKSSFASGTASFQIGQITVQHGGTLRQALSAPSAALPAAKVTPTKVDAYETALGIGLWSAVLSLTLAGLLNVPFFLNVRLRLLAGSKNFNDVEQALADAYSRNMSVAITLTTGKVYVGFTKIVDPNGAEPDWVSLWPLASGYRTRKGRLRLTTSYGEAYRRVVSTENSTLSLRAFQVTLPLDHIASIQNFSMRLYEEHFNFKEDTGESTDEAEPPESLNAEPAEQEAGEVTIEVSERIGPPEYVKDVPDPWLKFLKWTYHIAVTVAVIALPFNLVVSLSSILLGLFALQHISDPARELELLLEAARDV